MSKFLLSCGITLALLSPFAVFLFSSKPIKTQWENIKLGAEVWRDTILGKRDLPQ